MKAAKPAIATATDGLRGVVCFPARDIESLSQIERFRQEHLTRRCGVRPEIAGVIASLAFGEVRA